MDPSDQIVRPDHTPPARSPTGPVSVRGKVDIPRDAPPGRAYRIEGVLLSVAERVTSWGKPCFFLKVRDAAGGLLFVVVWDWQWARLRQQVVVNRPVVFDVLPPAGGRSAFTLA